MRILFCRVGWSSTYNGNISDKPVNGGEYNKTQIGHEIHNYKGCNGKYYGYVQSKNDVINVKNIDKMAVGDSIDNVLVIWISTKPTGGQFIVGWYKNATVYREHQKVPNEAMVERHLKDHNFYNIYSENVFLLPIEERKFPITEMGRTNVWFGKTETNLRVIDYINNLGNIYEGRISAVTTGIDSLVGKEKNAIVKIRINQDVYRKKLLTKYKKCCIDKCGVGNTDLLIASHLKPWADSDSYEKLDENNGLLLCPNHDKLVDSGLISFREDGSVIISEKLSKEDQIFMNISESMKVQVNEDNRSYIEYHRKNIFKN